MILRYHLQLSTNYFSRRKNGLYFQIVERKIKGIHHFVYYFRNYLIVKIISIENNCKKMLSRHLIYYIIGL